MFRGSRIFILAGCVALLSAGPASTQEPETISGATGSVPEAYVYVGTATKGVYLTMQPPTESSHLYRVRHSRRRASQSGATENTSLP
jgi:hypothetical protein